LYDTEAQVSWPSSSVREYRQSYCSYNQLFKPGIKLSTRKECPDDLIQSWNQDFSSYPE